MTEKTQTVWHCKVGVIGSAVLPKGADAPMRHAVHEAFSKLTALDPEFIFSGWGATLTEPELAVVENRLPREGNVMPQRNDGGPAFPIPCQDDRDCGPRFENGYGGMSLRQYAAIKLRVPDSGTDWLDNMIRQSLRTDLASKALAALIAEPQWENSRTSLLAQIYGGNVSDGVVIEQVFAEVSYTIADALLAARERS